MADEKNVGKPIEPRPAKPISPPLQTGGTWETRIDGNTTVAKFVPGKNNIKKSSE
jgi:hypothetical protein